MTNSETGITGSTWAAFSLKSWFPILILVVAVLVASYGLIALWLKENFAHRAQMPLGESDRIMEVLGVEMRYREYAGANPPVVFLHGYGQNMTDWQQTIAQLPRRHMVILDLIGFGGSARGADLSYDWESHRKHVLRLLDQLGINQFILVGHSMGGTLAAWMAAMDKDDRILGAVLIAPPGVLGPLKNFWPSTLVERPGISNSVANFVANSWPYRTVFEDSLARQILTNYRGYGKAFENALFDIHQPTMLIMSPGDDGVDFETSEVFKDRIDNLIFVEMPAYVQHNMNTENPELLATKLEEFFERIQP